MQAEHVSVAKALYDYEAAQPGELTVSEDEVLYVYGKDDDWLLVHSQKEGGKVGYVPGNYVEEVRILPYIQRAQSYSLPSGVRGRRVIDRSCNSSH